MSASSSAGAGRVPKPGHSVGQQRSHNIGMEIPGQFAPRQGTVIHKASRPEPGRSVKRENKGCPGRGGGSMLISRTTGSASVAPELVYADVGDAIDWLCETFGFTELWRADRHRARVAFGNGIVILADVDPQYGRAVPGRTGARSHAVTVKVENVDAHHDHARQHGARIVSSPADYPYGERQYTAEDLAGHHWTFTQAIADLAPEDWGGTSKTPRSDQPPP
jgi:uncharacterized glyoxalase superfamily protein PhnB